MCNSKTKWKSKTANKKVLIGAIKNVKGLEYFGGRW